MPVKAARIQLADFDCTALRVEQGSLRIRAYSARTPYVDAHRFPLWSHHF
jgi:hypothetical protein